MRALQTHIVAEYVYDRKCDYSLACRLSPGADGVNDGCEQLRQPADEQPDGEEDPPATDVGDHRTVQYDGEDTNGC